MARYFLLWLIHLFYTYTSKPHSPYPTYYYCLLPPSFRFISFMQRWPRIFTQYSQNK
ncbi:hypothetical protein GLYMA_18G263950v4 [Glycine max]|nr:hypothetical protein GLYMA_18G263950v4 [Glycine max]KAH1156265.1 hypothetical protein GYH30_051180 [Glycine max]